MLNFRGILRCAKSNSHSFLALADRALAPPTADSLCPWTWLALIFGTRSPLLNKTNELSTKRIKSAIVFLVLIWSINQSKWTKIKTVWKEGTTKFYEWVKIKFTQLSGSLHYDEPCHHCILIVIKYLHVHSFNPIQLFNWINKSKCSLPCSFFPKFMVKWRIHLFCRGFFSMFFTKKKKNVRHNRQYFRFRYCKNWFMICVHTDLGWGWKKNWSQLYAYKVTDSHDREGKKQCWWSVRIKRIVKY